MRDEQKLEYACTAYATGRNWVTAKGTGKGMIDRIFFLDNGQVLLVEFKTKTGRTSPKQKQTHRRLSQLGHTVHIITSFEQFIDCIKKAPA